jgi:hypothetical protein
MDSATGTEPTATSAAGRSLLLPGFLGLLATQFLTVTNDNIFRWLLIGIGKQHTDESQHAAILTAGTVCLVAPYLVLAAPAGLTNIPSAPSSSDASWRKSRLWFSAWRPFCAAA